jgi:hypothetical protein
MEPDLHKRHYFINQYKNKRSLFLGGGADDQAITVDSEYSHYKT